MDFNYGFGMQINKRFHSKLSIVRSDFVSPLYLVALYAMLVQAETVGKHSKWLSIFAFS